MNPNIWKNASLAFSRNTVVDVLKYSDFSQLDWVLSLCSKRQNVSTYLDLMSVVYRNMVRHYRCEYVYKNEIVKNLIRGFKKHNNTVVFNEFRVSDSIADLVMFNGESKAFEIKTEYDSTKRLEKQQMAYGRIFDKCYVVVPEEKLQDYIPYIDEKSGVISLKYNRGRMSLMQYRDALQNKEIDTEVLIRCLRTAEYERIVCSYYGELPNVSGADMFDACLDKMSKIPTRALKEMFLSEMKKRKNDVGHLCGVPTQLMQLCVSLNLKDKEITALIKSLNTKIEKSHVLSIS